PSLLSFDSISRLHDACLCQLSLFICSGVHRDLHSFPTRRSSDLLFGAGCQPGDDAHVALGGAQGIGVLGQPAAAHALELVGILGDRKSTRLNSSHVKISYAVFCLKKKKTTTTTQHTLSS